MVARGVDGVLTAPATREMREKRAMKMKLREAWSCMVVLFRSAL